MPERGRSEPRHSRQDPGLELLDLCETVKRQAESIAAKVVRRWREIARSEPWLALPEDLDFDHLPELIREMAAASLCTEFDRTLCGRLARTAAQHGDQRARQGFEDDLIYREYHLLRRGLWERLKQEYGESSSIHYASMRLDTISSLASAAALHGIHREELIAQNRWPQVLDDLLDQWPLPES